MRNDIDGFFEKIKRIPDITWENVGKTYGADCTCGGRITAFRKERTGHLYASCDRCSFRIET